MGNVHMDWRNIVVTPQNGAPIALSEITEMDASIDDSLEPWHADGTKFARLVVVSSSERGATIMGGDVGRLLAIPRGTPCTVTADLYHALTRDGPGMMSFEFRNAMFGKGSVKGQTNKYAGAQVTFMCFSPDDSDPVTITQ